MFNGDIGFVEKINSRERTLTVLFDDERRVVYDFIGLDELEPAYAVTVHKSQGSEFPCVVLPMYPVAPLLMTRNLFYTAVTRAKRLVVLVGRESAMRQMVDNDQEQTRYSLLRRRLEGGL